MRSVGSRYTDVTEVGRAAMDFELGVSGRQADRSGRAEASRWHEFDVKLTDGRTVAVGEFGPRDAPMIVYCHGHPGTRRELLLSQSLLSRSGIRVRVMALNRPGYGASTARPHLRFTTWPRDLEEVLEQLGVDDFALLGASGGAPFACAAARAMGTRVSRMAIVVGVAPPECPEMVATSESRFSALRPLAEHLKWSLIAHGMRSGRPRRWIDRAIRTMGPADRKLLRTQAIRAWFTDVCREAFAQGAGAPVHESRLIASDWGFDVSSVETPTTLWYGRQDANVPAAVGEWLRGRLPNSRLVIWPNHGHFTWAASNDVIDVARSLVTRVTVGTARPTPLYGRTHAGVRFE